MTFTRLILKIATRQLARRYRSVPKRATRVRRAAKRRDDVVISTRRVTQACSYCDGAGCVDCLWTLPRKDDGSRTHVTGITAWRALVSI